MPRNKGEILDVIRERAKLDYLSDLHDGAHRDEVAQAVLSVAEDSFDTETWLEAVFYITGTRADCTDAAQAKQVLLHRLAG